MLNCGYEMDYYDVLVNNFNWVFQPRNNDCFRTFGHPDEENRVLVGHTTKKVYDSKTWKKNVSDVIDAKLFQIFCQWPFRNYPKIHPIWYEKPSLTNQHQQAGD